MAFQTLRALFLHHLKSIYSSEHQLCRALPKVLEGVSSREVRSLVLEYLAHAEHHCEKLELVSHQMQEPLSGDRCRVMEAFLRQAIEFAETRGDERVLDLALISVMRQTGHFEKSSYEIARSLAEVLDEPETLKLIETMLSEEEQMERSFILLSEDMMDSAVQEDRVQREEPPGIAPQGNA